MQHPLIRLSHVGKNYPLMQQGRHRMAQVWARLKGAEPDKVFKALQDINFEVHRGQSLGLVGVNGAGKSTLLKIIAGVVKPTTGEMQCRGRIGALLELGAGFHPDYTGRENIFLACALMGLNAAETHERIDGILAFADIGDHIDQPIKHYSSGMVVRLGFAVATSVVPDILITDEVLAVGDESFQKKCISWMERFLSNGGTLLLCSHSMYHIQKLCQKAIWIDQGLLRLYGDAQDVSRQYLAWHEEKARLAGDQASHEKSFDEGSDKSGIYHIKKLSIIGEVAGEVSVCTSSRELLAINMGQALRVKGRIHSPDGRTPQVTLGIVRSDGTPVYGVVNEMDGYELSRANDGTFLFELVFTDLPLLPGRYIARAHAMDPEGMRLFDHVERSFEIMGDTRELGFCYLQHRWVSSIQVEGGLKNEST